MRCLSAYAMHHVTICQFYVTYVMHVIWTINHVSWTIISKACNFQTVHLNVNILEFVYQHSLNNYHQVSQLKASKENLVFKTNCGIRDAHKEVHTYNHHMPHKHSKTLAYNSPGSSSKIVQIQEKTEPQTCHTKATHPTPHSHETVLDLNP